MSILLQRYFCLISAVTTLVALSACGADAQEQQSATQQLLEATSHQDIAPLSDSSRAPITLDQSNKKCIDISGASHAVGTAVVLYDCHGGDNQAFAFENNRLKVYEHKCLALPQGQDGLGAKVVIANCDGTKNNQKWSRAGRGWEYNGSGKCLDLPSNSVKNATQLQIWTCNGTAAQKWSDTRSAAAPAPAPTQPTPSAAYLPRVLGTCPKLTTGMASFLGQQVQLWAAHSGAHNGSLVLYWHGTGGTSQEASWGFGDAQINDVVAKGGMVASFTNTTRGGANISGNGIWFTSDFVTADEVVACAVRDLHIDPRRIYVTGASAGGLMSTWMAYARSGYIAAAAPLSGGMLGQNGQWGTPSWASQDAKNVPFALVTHGGRGKDVYAPTNFDFANSSAEYESDIASKGGMSVDCNTGGGHVAGPPVIGPFVWQFFQSHSFKVSPEPYQGRLPAGFPSWCKIGPVPF